MPQGLKHDAMLEEAFRAGPRRSTEATRTLEMEFDAAPSAPASSVPAQQPMLVRLKDDHPWDPPAGFQMRSRLGTIVSGSGTEDALRALSDDPKVQSIEGSRSAGIFECAQSVPHIRADVVHRPPIAEAGDMALVGLIDSGIDVLHEAFLDGNGQSRIVEIWDQTDPTGPTPAAAHPQSGLPGYGAVHLQADITNYVSTRAVPPLLGRDPAQHGTHVASIAAGRKTSTFGGGVAPAAKLLVVKPKLEVQVGDPQSLGYSTSHIDALAYLKTRADMLNLPIVVNVSLGMNAGAHDGSSALEAGFDNFSNRGRDSGAIIVKSAGNERGHAGHANLQLGTGQLADLQWDSTAGGGRSEDLIELWFESSDALEFTLTNPNNQTSDVCSLAQPRAAGTFSGGENYVLRYTQFHQDNGDSRVIVMIQSGLSGAITAGVWKLNIRGVDVRSPGRVHAWFERLNSRPTRFLNHLNDEMTLSIPGTSTSVITVGAVDLNGANTNTSSFGLTRDGREKPDLVAPGAGIVAAMSGTNNATLPMTGTSMAAPHVTGAIALICSHHRKAGTPIPNAVQARAALVQTTMNFSGFHTNSRGFGVIDAEQFFNTLT